MRPAVSGRYFRPKRGGYGEVCAGRGCPEWAMSTLINHSSPDRACHRRGGLTLIALLKLFMAYLATERCLSPLTIGKYVRAVKRLKSWARWKRKPMLELTAKDCGRWKLGMLKGGLAPGTVNVMVIGTNRFFRYLQLDGYVECNPFEMVSLLPMPRALPSHLSLEEVDRLLAAPDISTYEGLLDRAILELLYAAGLRPAELASLELTAVNLGRRVLICIGKGGKQQVVPFGRSARGLAGEVPCSEKAYHWTRPDAVFLHEGRRRATVHDVRAASRKKHGLRAGLKDLSSRTLRHTYATHLHESGAEIIYIQLLAGHSRTDSTQVYTHVVQKRLRAEYDRHHPRASEQYRMPEKKAQRLKRRSQAMGR